MAPNLLPWVAMRRQKPPHTDQDGRTDRRWIVVADADESSANMFAGYLLHQRFRAYPTRQGARRSVSPRLTRWVSR